MFAQNALETIQFIFMRRTLTLCKLNPRLHFSWITWSKIEYKIITIQNISLHSVDVILNVVPKIDANAKENYCIKQKPVNKRKDECSNLENVKLFCFENKRNSFNFVQMTSIEVSIVKLIFQIHYSAKLISRYAFQTYS